MKKKLKIEENEKNFEDEVMESLPEELVSLLELLSGNFLTGRKIYLFGDIVTENILSVIEQIHSLEEKGDEDIEIFINSNGGYVVDCLALVDVMDASNCDIQTTILGIAASAACLIASNGTKGKRYAGFNSVYMFHEVVTDIPDFKASNAKYHTEETERIQKRFTTIFSKNTGKTSKEIIEKFYKNENNLDVFMTATQAKKFGIIDKIISGKNKKKRVKKNK